MILIYGEVLADCFPHERIIGGAPFNVARHLRAFGLSPVLLSRIGSDELGDTIEQAMKQSDLTMQGIQRDIQYPTGRVAVHVQGTEHHFEMMADQAYDYFDFEPDILNIQPIDLIYFGTLAQRSQCSRSSLYQLLSSPSIDSSTIRFCDLNLRSPWFEKSTIEQSLQHTDILKLNTEELETLKTLLQLNAHDLPTIVAELFRKYRLRRVVVTAGAKGAWEYDAIDDPINLPGEVGITLIDSVGAGDAFSAVYILGLQQAWSREVTMHRANAFAAAICEIRGATKNDAEFYANQRNSWLRTGSA